MKVQVIMPTAGAGSRFRSRRLKSLIPLNGAPVFIYPLKVFQKNRSIHSVIVPVPEGQVPAFSRAVKKFNLAKTVKIIPGGRTRQESVARGLEFLDDDTDFVIVHDGVRPLLSQKTLNEGLAAVKRFGAVITAVPVKSTIKRADPADMTVAETLERCSLWEVQTPQIFRKKILQRAHREFKGREASDDAMMVESLKVPVKVVVGDYRNIKITTREDLAVMKEFLRSGK